MTEFNYKEAIDQAEELQEIAEELQAISRKLTNQQPALALEWKGNSANLFLKKAEELCGDITRTAKTADRIGGAVGIAAKAIKKAEDAAKEIIKAVTT